MFFPAPQEGALAIPPHPPPSLFVQQALRLINTAVDSAYEDIQSRYRSMNNGAKRRAKQRALDFLARELPERMRIHRAYPNSDFSTTPPDTYLMVDYGKQGLTASHYRVLTGDFCVYYHVRNARSTKMSMEYLPVMLAYTLKELGVPVRLIEMPEALPYKKDGHVVDIGKPRTIVVLVNLSDLERIGL